MNPSSRIGGRVGKESWVWLSRRGIRRCSRLCWLGSRLGVRGQLFTQRRFVFEFTKALTLLDERFQLLGREPSWAKLIPSCLRSNNKLFTGSNSNRRSSRVGHSVHGPLENRDRCRF